MASIIAGAVLLALVLAARGATTGDARSATVVSVNDCELLEISADAFRGVVLTDPAIVERVAAAVAQRRAELERHRERARRPEPWRTAHRRWSTGCASSCDCRDLTPAPF